MAFLRQRYEMYLQRQPCRYGGGKGGFVSRGTGNGGRGVGSDGSGGQSGAFERGRGSSHVGRYVRNDFKHGSSANAPKRAARGPQPAPAPTQARRGGDAAPRSTPRETDFYREREPAGEAYRLQGRPVLTRGVEPADLGNGPRHH
jgi:hypothetical protein